MGGEDPLGGVGLEWEPAGEHFIAQNAEGVDVGAGVDVALPHRLFGGHVRGGPHRDPDRGDPVPARRLQRLGDAEVGHHRVAA